MFIWGRCITFNITQFLLQNGTFFSPEAAICDDSWLKVNPGTLIFCLKGRNRTNTVMTADFKQALFPDRDSPTRRTRERARESPDAWIRDERVPGRQTTFSSARVFFSLQLSQAKRMTARSLWLQKKENRAQKFLRPHVPVYFFRCGLPSTRIPWKHNCCVLNGRTYGREAKTKKKKIARGRAKRTEKQ